MWKYNENSIILYDKTCRWFPAAESMSEQILLVVEIEYIYEYAMEMYYFMLY